MSDAAQKAVMRAVKSWIRGTPDQEAYEFAAHVLAVLSETHAVVELPEPETGATWTVSDTDLEVRGKVDGSIELRLESARGGTLAKTYDASVGPDLAATLLAATRFAEATR